MEIQAFTLLIERGDLEAPRVVRGRLPTRQEYSADVGQCVADFLARKLPRKLRTGEYRLEIVRDVAGRATGATMKRTGPGKSLEPTS